MRDIQSGNQSQVMEFLIMGLSEYPDLKALFFMFFLCIYLVTLSGNLAMLTLMSIDSRLHTPMYFFLSNLAILDVCLTSCTIPKMLSVFLIDDKVISLRGCATQLYLLMSFTSVEFYLLAVMAYDRYVAICNPLHYSVIMNKRICALLSAGTWVTGFLVIVPHGLTVSFASYCGHNTINHLYCDFRSMMQLACSDITVSKLVVNILNLGLVLVCLVCMLTSYSHIISSIMKMQSMKGRSKAFSTCSSHLTVVSAYYGTVFFVYLRPISTWASSAEILWDASYCTLIPMFNPIIYSLRNKDVKAALQKGIQGRTDI